MANMDETAWRLLYAGDLTWAKKGAASVKIRVNHNTKEAITAIATITADFQKLPLYLIAKGKTEVAARNQVGGVEGFDYRSGYSVSGWNTKETMLKYLQFFREYMDEKFNTRNQTLHLLLDIYKSHCDSAVSEYCEQNKINLIYIPAGCTDLYQPLDIKVFGALKGMARGLWYTNYCSNPNQKFNKREATKTLLTCWQNLSTSSIESAWKQYVDLLNEEQEDDSVVRDISMDDDENIDRRLREGASTLRKSHTDVIRHILKTKKVSENENCSEDELSNAENEENTEINIIETITEETEGLNSMLEKENNKLEWRQRVLNQNNRQMKCYSTVGIENVGKSCAFSSALHIINITGLEERIQQPLDEKEVSYRNIIKIIL